jgi:phosphoglycerol transferase MdoB-like AlkP superfamily enzyme
MGPVVEGLADPGHVLSWARLAGAAITGLVVSLLLDLRARPAGAGRRTARARAIHASLFVLAFALVLLAVQRPAFAAALTLAAQLALVLVNNAKQRALREPFLFTDFGLFSQALRHPRLYLPFLGVAPAVVGALGFAAALYLGVVLEPPLARALGAGWFFAAATGLAVVAAMVLAVASRRALPDIALEASEDFARLGLLASVWLHWLAERRTPAQLPTALPFASPAMTRSTSRRNESLPDIVAVQSESFFDPRRMYPAIRRAVLARYDALLPRTLCHGRVTVPAWGANTMRSEFGFLTGLPAAPLGVDRFNPYRRLARRSLPTLASWLRAQGYRTICVHPHAASFFDRDRVFPQLGFDRFVDIGAFMGAPKAGPYVADSAVTRKILETLAESEQPAFVFAITMENHGPLHLEQPAPGDAQSLYSSPPPAGFDDLTVYLRHLHNADAMIGGLTASLANGLRERVLCFFGDHVPSMPEVYAQLRFEDGRSDYFVWRSDAAGDGHREDLAIDELGARLPALAGLAPAVSAAG